MDCELLTAQWSGKLPPGFVRPAILRQDLPTCYQTRCKRPVWIKPNGEPAKSCRRCPRSPRRFGNRAERDWARAVREVLAAASIASSGRPPEGIAPGIDATGDAAHGHREGRLLRGHCGRHRFPPLCAFAGDRLLAAHPRPAGIDPAKRSLGVLRLLAGRLRRAWPGARIVAPADSGFRGRRPVSRRGRHGAGRIPGLARNPRLAALAAPGTTLAEAGFAESGARRRRFAGPPCGARGRDRERRVTARIGHGPKGANPRFAAASLAGGGRGLHGRPCRARGEMGSRIKEQRPQLFADRAPCRRWRPNQFRPPPASLACALPSAVRRRGLAGADMARAQRATIRLKPLKIGAVTAHNARRVRFHLSSACPEQDLFRLVAARRNPVDAEPAGTARPARRRHRNRQPRTAPGIGENRPKPTDNAIPAAMSPTENRSPQRQRPENTPNLQLSPVHEISGLGRVDAGLGRLAARDPALGHGRFPDITRLPPKPPIRTIM